MSNRSYEDIYFGYDDDFAPRGKQKIPQKKKRKGHQTKYNRGNKNRDTYLFEEEMIVELPTIPSPPKVNYAPQPKKTITAPPPAPVPSITEDPTKEHVQTIRGFAIDFDNVADIQKVDQEHNEKMTYGIKFLFTGKKGLFKIIWFNDNQKARDSVFSSKFRYWTSIIAAPSNCATSTKN